MIKLVDIINEIENESIPYGGWMDRNAKFYPVRGYQQHESFALNYCESHHPDVFMKDLYPSTQKLYGRLFDDGFIRIVFNTHVEPVLYYNYKKELPPTPKQIKELRDIAIEYGIRFISDATLNKTDNIDESHD